MRQSITTTIVVLSLFAFSCTAAPASPTVVQTLSPTPDATLVLPDPTPPPAPATATVQATPVKTISPEAEAYLNEALDIMQAHSINRTKVDWTVLRPNTIDRAGAAQDPADTYEAIRYALFKLGDQHSFFMDPAQSTNFTQAEMSGSPDPEGQLMDEKLGYVNLPAFSSGNQVLMEEYASKVQSIIQELDANHPCGWLVDLRQNQGGNMWPMLAGIGPILGDGLAGSFIDPNGDQIDWFYTSGISREGDGVRAQVNGSPYQLQSPHQPVAVLLGPETASSGEAIAVSFLGLPNTRTFGRATAGLTTANEMYPMSDGATIVLTVAVYADRTGKVYGHEIVPDEVVWDKPDTAPDEVITAASQWLLTQPGCTNSQ